MKPGPRAIEPCGPVCGTVTLPGSKSISARAILCAALARGQSELPGVLSCDDTRYLASALTETGIVVSFGQEGTHATVDGLGGDFPVRSGSFSVGNAGTAMRFLTGVLTVAEGTYRLDGNQRMRARPIGELVEALQRLGAQVRCEGGYPPVQIGPRKLRGGRVHLSGSHSSQFITAILLAAPYSEKGVELHVDGPVVSRPYLALTRRVMELFRCRVFCRDDPLVFRVGPGRYHACTFPVEPDASSASYFFAAAALTGGSMAVEGLGASSIQGDMAMVDVLQAMGCTVRKDRASTTVTGGPLRGVSVNARDFPDLVPTIAVVAACAAGRTEIRGVPHLRLKESDRIQSVATELRKLGALVEERPDGLVVHGGKKLTGAVIDPWGDHRIAMAFSVLGLVVPGVVIAESSVVAKSFPDFFQVLSRLTEGAERDDSR